MNEDNSPFLQGRLKIQCFFFFFCANAWHQAAACAFCIGRVPGYVSPSSSWPFAPFFEESHFLATPPNTICATKLGDPTSAVDERHATWAWAWPVLCWLHSSSGPMGTDPVDESGKQRATRRRKGTDQMLLGRSSCLEGRAQATATQPSHSWWFSPSFSLCVCVCVRYPTCVEIALRFGSHRNIYLACCRTLGDVELRGSTPDST